MAQSERLRFARAIAEVSPDSRRPLGSGERSMMPLRSHVELSSRIRDLQVRCWVWALPPRPSQLPLQTGARLRSEVHGSMAWWVERPKDPAHTMVSAESGLASDCSHPRSRHGRRAPVRHRQSGRTNIRIPNRARGGACLGIEHDRDRSRDHHQPKRGHSRGHSRDKHGAVTTRHEYCLVGPNRLIRAELVWLSVCSLGSRCTSRCRSSLSG